MRTAGHSGSMIENTTVSRNEPSGSRRWWRSTPSCLAPSRVIGMTTYLNADLVNRRLEIGFTWNARSAQRTGTNTESKLLLLKHAFEELGCIAVEFRTHWMNQQSRAAIERLGAKQDGILRSHRLQPDGSLRDTVVFSIIACEWPAVRNELRRRLLDGAGR